MVMPVAKSQASVRPHLFYRVNRIPQRVRRRTSSGENNPLKAKETNPSDAKSNQRTGQPVSQKKDAG